MPLLAFSLGKKQSKAKHPQYTYSLFIIVLKIVEHDLWIKNVKLQSFTICESFMKVISLMSYLHYLKFM